MLVGIYLEVQFRTNMFPEHLLIVYEGTDVVCNSTEEFITFLTTADLRDLKDRERSHVEQCLN